MAVLLSGAGITVGVDITDSRSLVAGSALGIGSRRLSNAYAFQIASGIAAGQVDKVWGDARTVTTGATDSMDLATGGNLIDSFGAAVVIVKLRALVFCATGIAGVANTTLLSLTRPAANGVPIFSAVSSGAPTFSAGGLYVWADSVGVTVTAATADLITVVNSAGASAGYDIYFVGTSA